MELHEYENREICAKCGGLCCKISGCDYFVSDFDNMRLEYLEELLNTGRVSVTGNLAVKNTKEGKLYVEVILALKARNVGREEIDLWSVGSKCVNLEDDGCYYDVTKRPSGGLRQIAKPNLQCYPDYDIESELNKWIPYQNVLRKLVKRRTGMTVEAKLRHDIEETFYNIFANNLPNSLSIAKENALRMVPGLSMLYPEEYGRARKRANGIRG